MAALMMISMSLVHSPSVELLRCTASVTRYERRKNSVIQEVPGRSQKRSIFHKMPETAHTSCYMVILMSFVHSSSFRMVQNRSKFSPL